MNKSQNDMNFHSGAAESPGQRAPPKATPGKKPGATDSLENGCYKERRSAASL